MKSTLIELPPILLESNDDIVELEFLDELEVEPDRRSRLFKPGSKFGAYDVIGFIAAGGMGEVYAAERVMPDGQRLGPVALKVMAPDYRDDHMVSQRFRREAKISRAIRSTHVPLVFEFGETDDRHLFLVMELLKGEELFDRLCQRYSLTEIEVARVALAVLEGLTAIHAHGFVHRDLKPENIYFHQLGGGEEVVKILDFGIAKIATEESDPYLSVVGRIYGTPEYIAPEQGLNPEVDQRADLYSVGVIMYECLTGSLPFEGETPYVTILAHQTEEVPPLPSTIDPELAEIVYKALAKDPDDRFQSAAEMADLVRYWILDREEDELGVSLRDSSDLIVPDTGVVRTEHLTPAPLERHRRKRQVVKTGEADLSQFSDKTTRKKIESEPGDLDADISENLPPVQIFSKPKRAGASSDELQAVADEEEIETIRNATTAEHDVSAFETMESSRDRPAMIPALVTGVAVLLVVAAIAWSFV